MAKGIPLKLALWLNAGLVSLSLSLWQSSYTLTQAACTERQIRDNVEQFKNDFTAKNFSLFEAVIKYGQSAVPVLIKVLQDKKENENVRSGAALALGQMGEIAQDAVPELVEALGDTSETVRSNALSSLSLIGKALANMPNNELKWWEIQKLKHLKQ